MGYQERWDNASEQMSSVKRKYGMFWIRLPTPRCRTATQKHGPPGTGRNERQVGRLRHRVIHGIFVSAALSLALAGCKPDTSPPPGLHGAMRAMAMAAQPGAADRRISFSHEFAVELPNSAVEATQQKNLTDCLAAGCTVLNSRLDRLPDGAVQGSISVRIAPDRYPGFAEAITAPPARLISRAEAAVDETAPMLDVEKRLAAQTALRDRLLELLKQAGSGVSDLVAGEKQLADVQGTIESETAQRDYLRTITDTVKVDVSYNGLIQQAGPFDVSPIRAAIDRFAQDVILSLGQLISCVAYALPWVPLALLAGWIGRRLVRRG
jgi:hypothetical protein